MTIKKAIIPVAGYGTRRLPITKAIEKCMLPVLNRPIIDYIVADCISAGVEEFYIVVGEESEQVRRYFGNCHRLKSYLVAKNKVDDLELIRPPSNVKFHFIEQPDDGRYGTAIPVALCSSYIGQDERVLVCMGDDFLWRADGQNEIAILVSSYVSGSALVGVKMPAESLSSYGVIDMDTDSSYKRIIERPPLGTAPSDYINVSKYIFTKDLLKEIEQYTEASREGEYMIVDPVNNFVDSGGVVSVYRSEAEFLDGGTLDGWLHANELLAKHAK